MATKLSQQQRILRDITEKQLDATLKDLALMLGWKVYHTFNSKFSVAGFPDWTLVRERIVFIENKRMQGKMSQAQEEWRDAILSAGGEWDLLRPDGLQQMAEILKGGRPNE